MTKDEFKSLMNTMIRRFNDNHDVHINIVMVDTKNNEAVVLGSDCPVHMIVAAACLTDTLANRVLERVKQLEATVEQLNEAVADEILRSPLHPNEKGA